MFSNNQLKNVQNETIQYVMKTENLKNSEFFRFNFNTLPSVKKLNTPTKIEVFDGDTLEATLKYQHKNNKRYCFLILANAYHPGGGWEHGAKAQEESVCRRSNIWLAFDKINYPLDEFGGIYGKNVAIFRDTKNNNFKFLNKIHFSNCIFIAAYSNPPLKSKTELEKEYAIKTKKKIISMLTECLKRGDKNLVLGALGCGAFANPPDHIAKIFKEVLHSDNFKDRFEHVVFAIIDNKYTKNREIFENILCSKETK